MLQGQGPGRNPEDDRDLVEVHLTAPDRGTALRLAHLLVDERLAACAQVVPGVTSVYVWDGEVRQDDEHLLLLKSTAGRFPSIRDRVRTEHPYELPELVAVRIADCDPGYGEWVRHGVGGHGDGGTNEERAR